MTKKVKTRIAPSPTGNLHLGTVRTAFYNMLFAKANGGDFYFRLEDTDIERSKQEFYDEIFRGFEWLGITWNKPENFETEIDERGVVRQSLREDDQHRYIQQLLNDGLAYKCYATPEELDAMRAAQRAAKKAEGYDNRGRHLTAEQLAAYKAEGRKAVIRLRLNEGQHRDIKWTDMVRGDMCVNTDSLGGDMVIQKANGQVLYNFAVVIDDAEMGISHVIRGEDHLTNTAKQIIIYEALGFEVPTFGHLPLIFTTDRQKLSKRKHGDIAGIAKYQKEGYLPEALANYLMATSYTHASKTEDSASEIYTLEELAAEFDMAGISKSPAIYDIKKLNWFNREYISKLSVQELYKCVEPFLEYPLEKEAREFQESLLGAVRGNLDKFEDINREISYFFEDIETPRNMDQSLREHLVEGEWVLKELLSEIMKMEENSRVDFDDPDTFKKVINDIGKSLGKKGKELFWPIRVAISARTHGPDLGLIFVLLGKDKVKHRLQQSLQPIG